jgi:hypothetical protein
MNEGVGTKNSSQEAALAAGNVTDRLKEGCEEQQEDFQILVEDVSQAVSAYCQRRPSVAALSLFAVGFFVGWKLKPW